MTTKNQAQSSGSDWDEVPSGATQALTVTVVGASQPGKTEQSPLVPSHDAEEDEEVDLKKIELPNCLAKSLVLLQKAEAMPERTHKEEAEKSAALKVIRKHVFTLQQGLPILHSNADDMVIAHQRNEEIFKRSRLEAIARQYPEVKELLEKYDDLRHFLSELYVESAVLSDESHANGS